MPTCALPAAAGVGATHEANDRARWLVGPACECSHLPDVAVRPWKLILLGAPGVGKGTQAELLCAKLGACHLSTGDVFRAAKAQDEAHRSPAMTEALGYMTRGELVPDETVLAMLRERTRCLRCHCGFLLDGFPRTVPQAQALFALLDEQGIVLDAVLDYRLPVDAVVARMGGRRTCPSCKAVYHETARPPRRAGVCDRCQTRLMIREDDQPEAIRIRMAAYDEQTVPLEAFFQRQGLLMPIDASGTPEAICERTLDALQVPH